MCKFSCMNKSEESRLNFDIDEFWNWNQFYERWRSKKSAIYNACDVDQFQNKFSDWSDFEFNRYLFSCEDQNRKIKHLSSFFCCKSFWLFFHFRTISLTAMSINYNCRANDIYTICTNSEMTRFAVIKIMNRFCGFTTACWAQDLNTVITDQGVSWWTELIIEDASYVVFMWSSKTITWPKLATSINTYIWAVCSSKCKSHVMNMNI